VRVLAAWLAPGRTRFRADAALASDRIGRAPSALGAALLGLTLLGGTPRGRRRLAPWLARRRARGTAAALLAAAAAGALLLACAPRSEEHSLRLLRGAFPHAHVEARIPGGEWTPCRFAALLRDYECPGLGRIGDGVAFVLQDHPSSTPFLTPAIVARPEQARVEYRVRATGRFSGSYWAAGWGPGSGTLGCGGSALPLTRRKQALAPAPGATAACEVVLRTRGRALQGATLVRADALDLDRTRDVPWAPPEPTASPGPPRRP
jgi:hypothetical protein